MLNKKMKKGGAVILSAALLLSAFVLPNAYADVAKNTKECSVEINVQGEDFGELSSVDVTVDLYKVADVSKSGIYTGLAPFDEMDFAAIGEATTAEDWRTMAAEAAQIIVDNAVEAVDSVVVEDGSVVVSGLEAGMYLISARDVESAIYQYQFTPYLVAMPTYYVLDDGTATDWIYDLQDSYAVGLKPVKTDLYGDLLIEKYLEVYNETNKGATFVFQIEATKKDGSTERVVYSDVVALTFEQPGMQSLLVEDIPAGAEVVVTEVYSGANYKLTSAANVTTTIIADGLDGAPASVSFTNTHDGRTTGGSGIVNHFEYDAESEQWLHEVPGQEE